MIKISRGGLMTDEDHSKLALWAAACAEHVLHLFEDQAPHDFRARAAIEAARSWARETMTMMQARAAGGHAMAAARPLSGAARFAAFSAGQAACVGHVAEHDLGAAAYAIKAAQSEHPDAPHVRIAEREWQRAQLPKHLRALVIEDQKRRDAICWHVFRD